MIELISVGKKYTESNVERWVLRNVNTLFPSKGLVSIKGESGSGKSTLLNLISMQESLDEGNIKINGRNVSKLTSSEKEDMRLFSIGLIFQHFNLFDDLSAYENVKLALDIQGEKSKFNESATNAIFKKYGLEDLKEKKCSLLSGGEKQRVAFLRAIIRNPDIILADEPTGALDSKNEKIIMDSLKEYSLDHLVIMVSHNQRVINKYSDMIFELKDGSLTCLTKTRVRKDMKSNGRRERGKGKDWMFSILKERLKKDWKRNLLSFLGTFVSTAGLLISLGFMSSSKETLNKEKTNTLLYTTASVSVQESYEIEGSPLVLTRTKRPTVEDVKSVFGDNVTIENNYSYFLPSYSAYYFNGEAKDPVSFSPISDISLTDRSSIQMYEGSAPNINSLEYVLVNKEFASLFDESVLQHEIKLSNSVSIEVDGVQDDLNLEFNFYVAGVVEEFSFLNSPRVYYSNYSLRSYFDRMNLENISKYKGGAYDVLDLLDDIDGDSPYASYSYNIFFSEQYAKTVEKLISTNGGLEIKSEAIEVANTFSKLVDSFSMALIPFLALILVGTIAIDCFTSHSLYLSKRKESAILNSLGCRESDAFNILLYESAIVGSLSSVASLLISIPLSRLFSELLQNKIGLKNLVDIHLTCLGIPFLPVLVVLIISLGFPLLGMITPNIFRKRSSLVKELRDE